MKSRLVLLFVLGVWMGATVFMWMVATQNFHVVEKILASHSTGFGDAVSALTPEQLRLALRYQASEVNRLFFEGWGMLQPPIAVIALLLAWRSQTGRTTVILLAAMLLITLFLQLYVVPQTVLLGRALDFLSRDPAPPEAAPFWRLHHTYTGLDMLKFVLGLAASLLIVLRSFSADRAWDARATAGAARAR